MTTPGWQRDAACRGHDPETWFPKPGEHDKRERAKAICAGCPVRSACLADALAPGKPNGHLAGIWGGWTEHERGELRKGQRPGRKVGRTNYVPEQAPRARAKKGQAVR